MLVRRGPSRFLVFVLQPNAEGQLQHRQMKKLLTPVITPTPSFHAAPSSATVEVGGTDEILMGFMGFSG